ncbi:MAG: GatB/YqeY domain-containing protein, partial [Notoacmeibacter sp.]
KDPINDDEIVTLLRKMIKQRDDSIAMYDTGGRQELADKERQEIAIISAFIPQQMSAEDVAAACKAVIAELGATSPRDMGKCMALLKERYAGKMDFTVASATIKTLLT